VFFIEPLNKNRNDVSNIKSHHFLSVPCKAACMPVPKISAGWSCGMAACKLKAVIIKKAMMSRKFLIFSDFLRNCFIKDILQLSADCIKSKNDQKKRTQKKFESRPPADFCHPSEHFKSVKKLRTPGLSNGRSILRCILKIARTHFAAFGGVGGGQKSKRLRREH